MTKHSLTKSTLNGSCTLTLLYSRVPEGRRHHARVVGDMDGEGLTVPVTHSFHSGMMGDGQWIMENGEWRKQAGDGRYSQGEGGDSGELQRASVQNHQGSQCRQRNQRQSATTLV